MFLSWVKTQLTPGIMLCGKRRLVQPLARTWIMNLLLFTYRCVCYISIYLSLSPLSLSISSLISIHTDICIYSNQAKNFTDIHLSKQIYIKSCSCFYWCQLVSISFFLDWVLSCTLGIHRESYPKSLMDLILSLQWFPDCHLHILQFTSFQCNWVSCSAGKDREEKATLC